MNHDIIEYDETWVRCRCGVWFYENDFARPTLSAREAHAVHRGLAMAREALEGGE